MVHSGPPWQDGLASLAFMTSAATDPGEVLTGWLTNHGAPRSRRRSWRRPPAVRPRWPLPPPCPSPRPPPIRTISSPGADNATTATTSITDSTADSVAFAASRSGNRVRRPGDERRGRRAVRLERQREPDRCVPADAAYTGAFGWAPTDGGPELPRRPASGVTARTSASSAPATSACTASATSASWGESVSTDGRRSSPWLVRHRAWRSRSSGKVKFSRSGRATIAKSKSTSR